MENTQSHHSLLNWIPIKIEPENNDENFFPKIQFDNNDVNPLADSELENLCKKELDLDWNEEDNVLGENYVLSNEINKINKFENVKKLDQKCISEKVKSTKLKKTKGRRPKRYKKCCTNCKIIVECENLINTCSKCQIPLVYQCKMCNTTCPTANKIMYHVRICDSKLCSYHCPECAFASHLRASVLQHAKRCHPTLKSYNIKQTVEREQDSGEVKLSQNKCSKCGEQFFRIQDLNNHSFSCYKVLYIGLPKCKDSDITNISDAQSNLNSTTLRLKKLSVHYCEKCSKESQISRPRAKNLCDVCQTPLLFKCLKCSKQCASNKAIDYHLSVCEPQGLYQCSECNYSSLIRKYVVRHYNSMHDSKTYECKECGRICKNRQNFKLHMQRYCGLKPSFHCDNCPFYSESKRVLRNHILKEHIKRKRFACPKCNKTYKCDYSLDYHLTVCGKKPDFKCEQCCFKTKYGFELQRHVRRIHSEEAKKKKMEFSRVRNIIDIDHITSTVVSVKNFKQSI